VSPVPPAGDQLYVYVGVPPEALSVAAPSLPPLQLASVIVDALTVRGAGSFTVAVVDVVQTPLAVTVTVYVPLVSPLTSSVVADVLHAYVKGLVPPVQVRSTEPLLPPAHETSLTLTESEGGVQAGTTVPFTTIWLIWKTPPLLIGLNA